MKTKTEYVKVDMTNSEIAKAMIDGEVFYSEDGLSTFRWHGDYFIAEHAGINCMRNTTRIDRLSRNDYFRKTEVPTTKWDDAIEHIDNLKGTMVIHGDNITVSVCATEDGLLDFARILLEGDEE